MGGKAGIWADPWRPGAERGVHGGDDAQGVEESLEMGLAAPLKGADEW